jgi:hypothetical protein
VVVPNNNIYHKWDAPSLQLIYTDFIWNYVSTISTSYQSQVFLLQYSDQILHTFILVCLIGAWRPDQLPVNGVIRLIITIQRNRTRGSCKESEKKSNSYIDELLENDRAQNREFETLYYQTISELAQQMRSDAEQAADLSAEK